MAIPPPRADGHDDGMPGIVRATFERVRTEVAAACARAGRDPGGVTIVGVTKYVGVAAAGALLAAGCTDLAESRPQALWDKAAALPRARWHLVGRLQRNKVRRTLPLVSLLHTLDSVRLLGAIEEEEGAGRVLEVLVEVNLDGDPRRAGVAPDGLGALLDAAAASARVRVRGLMGMASLSGGDGGADTARRQFAALRALRERFAADHPGLVELSMGMSGDFPEAILEGATIVRIGSALWEGLGAGA
ncbi:MAG: YggS family pyridoxal phosphate-dependent enzyme [Planctomycetaceae bacterium]